MKDKLSNIITIVIYSVIVVCLLFYIISNPWLFVLNVVIIYIILFSIERNNKPNYKFREIIKEVNSFLKNSILNIADNYIEAWENLFKKRR